MVEWGSPEGTSSSTPERTAAFRASRYRLLRVLEGFLGAIDVPQETDEGREDASGLLPIDLAHPVPDR